MAATHLLHSASPVRSDAAFRSAARRVLHSLPRPRTQRQRRQAIALLNVAFAALIAVLVSASIETEPGLAGIYLKNQASDRPVTWVVMERTLR